MIIVVVDVVVTTLGCQPDTDILKNEVDMHMWKWKYCTFLGSK